MNTFEIVSALDAEIARLQQAKTILQGIGGTAKRGRGRPAKSQDPLEAILTTRPSKKRRVSAEGRARIAAAQKARWTAHRKETEAAATVKTVAPAKKASAKAAKKTAAKQ